MQQHREEAQTAAVHRRMKDAARLADLQAMLPRQQVILVLTCQLFFPRLTYAYIYSNITETLLEDNFQPRDTWYIPWVFKVWKWRLWHIRHTTVFLFPINSTWLSTILWGQCICGFVQSAKMTLEFAGRILSLGSTSLQIMHCGSGVSSEPVQQNPNCK